MDVLHSRITLQSFRRLHVNKHMLIAVANDSKIQMCRTGSVLAISF